MQNYTILLVDSDPHARRVVRSLLASRYQILEACSGEEALQKLTNQLCDCVLLDLNLPGLDGIATCRAIRAIWDTPIVALSTADSDADKAVVRQAGADDCLRKPCGLQALLTAIQAISRKAVRADGAPRVLVLHSVSIDFDRHRVMSADREERLTPKQYELLRYMVSHAGQVLSHRRMLQAVWGPDYGDEVQYLRVFVNQLRNKIEEDAHHPKYLLTEPWIGYRFVPPM